MDPEPIREIARRLEQSLSQQVSNTEQPTPPSPSECKACGGIGYIRAGNTNALMECECLIERRVLSRLPPRFRKATLLDFPPPAQAAVLDWFRRPGDGLLITGPVGTGKTHLMAAIARTLLSIHQEAIFRRCGDLYLTLRETFTDEVSELEVLDEYCRPKWVMLDDLGAGSLSDFERRTLLEILDRRFNAERPTVVTTNWSLEEIAERIDDRIASRISSLHILQLNGEDRRMR